MIRKCNKARNKLGSQAMGKNVPYCNKENEIILIHILPELAKNMSLKKRDSRTCYGETEC